MTTATATTITTAAAELADRTGRPAGTYVAGLGRGATYVAGGVTYTPARPGSDTIVRTVAVPR